MSEHDGRTVERQTHTLLSGTRPFELVGKERAARPTRAAASRRSGSSPTAASVTPVAAEHQITARAHAIYIDRTSSGRWGDAISDWVQAERELGGDPAGSDERPFTI